MTKRFNLLMAVAGVMVATPSLAQITPTANNNATALGATLQGSGITFNSATLVTNTQNGTFTGGTAGTGIASGVVLTTGSLGCVGPANTSSGCEGSGNSSILTLGFTATSSSLFFNYVFASEEYPEFVGTSFNDSFSLNLTGANYAGTNLAQLPGGAGVVSINNVNATTNAAFFRANSGAGSLNLPIEFDGLTTLLTASATNLVVGTDYLLAFSIADVGDSRLDSAVFIQGGSVGVVNPGVPEPATWAMMMLGIGAVGGAMRGRRAGKAKLAIA